MGFYATWIWILAPKTNSVSVTELIFDKKAASKFYFKKYTITHFFYYCAFCVSLRESSQFFVHFFPSNEMTHIFRNSCFLIVSLFFTFTRHPGAKKLFDIFVQSLPFFWHFISTFRQKSFFRRSFRHSSSFRRFIRTWWSGQEFWWFWWTEMFEVGN